MPNRRPEPRLAGPDQVPPDTVMPRLTWPNQTAPDLTTPYPTSPQPDHVLLAVQYLESSDLEPSEGGSKITYTNQSTGVDQCVLQQRRTDVLWCQH